MADEQVSAFYVPMSIAIHLEPEVACVVMLFTKLKVGDAWSNSTPAIVEPAKKPAKK